MAQEAAHFLGKEEVAGSNPAISSKAPGILPGSFNFCIIDSVFNSEVCHAEYHEIKIL